MLKEQLFAYLDQFDDYHYSKSLIYGRSGWTLRIPELAPKFVCFGNTHKENYLRDMMFVEHMEKNVGNERDSSELLRQVYKLPLFSGK